MSEEPESEGIEADVREIGERLAQGRPVPAGTFRGALGRLLAASDPGYGPRPEGLRGLVVAIALIGGALIVLGSLQALGSL